MKRFLLAAAILLVVCALLPGVAAAGRPAPAAAAVDPTAIVGGTSSTLMSGVPTTLKVTLRDTVANAPIPGVNLSFAERTSFAQGTTFGWLVLGTATTDANGEAGVAYTPVHNGTYTVVVSFAGNSTYAPSNATLTLTVLAPLPPSTPPISPDLAIVLVILVVVGGVWMTYGGVAWLVLGIRADRPEPEVVEASSLATESEVSDSMADQVSEEQAQSGERAIRAKRLAVRNAVIIAATVALVVGILVGIGLGTSLLGSAGPSSTPTPEHLYLTIGFNPGTGLDEYFPANFSVPVGVPVTITITNYDNGTNPVSAADAQVAGTVDGTESVQLWGQAAQNVSSVDPTAIAHTFTISQSPYDLNVPIPPAASLSQPTVVTFTSVFGTAGTFTWRCITPCDPVAMDTPGFMQGTVTVG